MAKNIDPRLTSAMHALASGQVEQADALCRSVLQERRRDDLAMALLAQVCNQTGKYEEALQLIRNAIARNGKRADYHGLLADMLCTQGNFRGAIGAYDKALKYQPNHPGVLAGKANTWLRLHHPEKAINLLKPVMKGGKEDLTIATVYAKALIKIGNPADAAAVLLGHLPADREPVETRRSLYFVLGKAMENAGEFKSSFEAYEQGNALSQDQYDHVDCQRKTDDIKLAFPLDATSPSIQSRNEESTRVFIVGMPRSGSTLTEQIIDAHPDGVGLGEIETFPTLLSKYSEGQSISDFWKNVQQSTLNEIAHEYIDSTKKVEKVIVDKQLGNYPFMGMIAALLPQAKFIHCTRNPMSIGLSCFAEKLPPRTNAWSNDLGNIGKYYRQYDAIMKHWDLLLGNKILEVNYEALIADQEHQTKRILDFCGLPFDERCMRFWESGRVVLTLSQDQVHQPLYASSVERFVRFGTLLDPLREALDQ
jgi:tetratricopeptide (TPR) repeat protein